MRAPYFFERIEWVYFNWLYSLGVLLHPTQSAQAVNRHTSRINGDFPRENANGIIFSACNDYFLDRFGYNLVLSCYERAHECSVHLHLYEPSAVTFRRLESMRSQFPDLKLSYTYESDIDFGTLPERGMYYTAFRFVAARRLLEESKSSVICLDADSLIMNSLQPVFAEARQHDVGLYLRPEKRRVTKKIAAFAVILNPTQKALAFIDMFSAIAIKFHSRYPKLRWIFYFDQSALYLCFLLSSLRGRTSFYRLRKSVVDFEFSAAACIWTAKGRRKNDAVFLTESRRIMERYHWGHHDHAGLAASR